MNAKLFMLHYIDSINKNITVPCSRNTVLLCSPADLWSNQRIRWADVKIISVDPFSSGDSMRPTMREDVCFLLESDKMWTTKKRRWEGGGGGRGDVGRERRAAVLSWSHTPSWRVQAVIPWGGGAFRWCLINTPRRTCRPFPTCV